MKLSPRPLRPSALVLLLAGMLFIGLVGCGRSHRSASTLSERDRTVLAKYETIRAALVVDDLRKAKRTAADLGKFLKPTPESPATPLDTTVQELADAPALDKARTAFKTLSGSMITLVDGMDGFYVMDSPSPEGAEWVQTVAQVDNPYMGQPMRNVGSLRK